MKRRQAAMVVWYYTVVIDAEAVRESARTVALRLSFNFSQRIGCAGPQQQKYNDNI